MAEGYPYDQTRDSPDLAVLHFARYSGIPFVLPRPAWFEITFQEPTDDPFFGNVRPGRAMIMLKFLRILRISFTVIASLAVGSLSVSCKHRVSSKVSKQSTQESIIAERLAQNIPKADPKNYYPVGQHWKNPTIFIDLSGVFIILEDQSVRQATSLTNLGRDLAALPVSAWALGRVVVFAQSARVPVWLKGNPEPDNEAYRNAAKTIKILKSLNLDIVYAPIN
jgi:hypothetical protein